MYVNDLVDALAFVLKRYNAEEHINAGVGEEVSIRQLAIEIAGTVRAQSSLRFDEAKPDGPPRKLMDPRHADE